MYHHHSQPQGPPSFSNAPRPPQLPQNPLQSRPASGMRSQTDFQYPGPTQLPSELQSALAMRGAMDVDHRSVDNNDIPNQHQGQSSSCGISQHGNYSSNPVTFTSDSHPGHQQGVGWSSYASSSKMFVTPSPHSGHVPQNSVQKPQSSHTGSHMPNWAGPAAKHLIPPRGGGDGQSFYTAESAGSILASFGLSNDDLEVLSHYPDDQLTPDTLPFILRDIQINKSGDQKTTSAPSFSRSVQNLSPSSSSSLAHSQSSEVPSLLTVTQTAGKVIDYGHASRAKEETDSRETFKREQLSSERRVNQFPLPALAKGDKTERHQVNLKHAHLGKHGDQDYRRTDGDHRKSSRSPGREFPPPPKSRHLDRDYRCEGPKPRPSPKRGFEEPLRRSVPSFDSKPHGSGGGGGKKLPTPTMIRDFSSVAPKVFPHTCSLCHIQCDQEKDWGDHINTVNHISACRDLRNKYPDWKADFPSSWSGRYGSRTFWDPREHSSAHSRPHSYSPSRSPPQNTHREGPHPNRPYKRPYSPQRHPQSRHYPAGPPQPRGKRPHDYVTQPPGAESHHPPAKVGHSWRHEPLPAGKGVVKPKIKTVKPSSAKAANPSAKPPPEKKKKVVTAAPQHSAASERLVYLTGIPKDASEEEVTSLVGSFGKINNVILIPSSGEQSDKDEGQKASVCMVKPEDAQNLASSTELFIRQQKLTASVAKKPEGQLSSDPSNSKNSAEGKSDLRISEKNGLVLISGLPEDEWSETDIEKLVQPFGTPSGMILAKQIGKVVVYVPNKDVAEEMVNVNSFMPMKFDSCHLKISHIKQFISLSTPVALYNALMGSTDQESSAQVGWSSLLVIQNVPHASNGSSEVQKLVRRFGTVIRSLVLHNMVICEMATAAMALSVYKRFQAFPCIIQNNPLIFSRKADPKPSAQSKSSPAPPQPAENKIQECDLDTAEKKTDGSKEENHPSGENTTHANVPPAEPAVPELPKNITREVENQLSDEAASRTSSQFSNATASNEGEEEATPQEDKQVEVRAEESKEQAEAPKTPEKEQKGKETRKESDAREAKERDRQSWEREKVQGERDRTERARRERDRREEKRKERAKVDRKSTSAVRSSSKSQKDEKQSSPSTDPTRMETEEDFDPFPFNMCDFVTVDEVGDVADLPLPLPLPPSPTTAVETPQEDPPAPEPKDPQTGDAVGATVDPDNRTAECEHTPAVRASPRDSEPTVEPPSPPAETENKAAAESCVGGGQPPVAARPEEGERTSNSSAPGTEARQNQEVDSQHGKEEQDEAERLKGPAGDVTPAVGSAKVAADGSKSDAQRGKEKVSAASPANSSSPLPPFSPHNPVGMEFLAPKTGFFCKACNRFFSGAKEAEIAHCKTRKHYDNVKTYLQTPRTDDASVSSASGSHR